MKSLIFTAASSQYLSRTFASGNLQKFTWAGWVKRAATGARHLLFSQRAATPGWQIEIQADNTLFAGSAGDGSTFNVISTTTIADTNWHHLCVAVDTTQGTAAGRCRIYVDGTEVSYSSQTCPLNYNTGTNTANSHQLGAATVIPNYDDGKMADVFFIDGLQLTPSSFVLGTGFGSCYPKFYGIAESGLTFGTNGFRLTFDNAASTTTLGQDDGTGAPSSHAGSNDWTLNAMSTGNSSADVPAQQPQVGAEIIGGGMMFMLP